MNLRALFRRIFGWWFRHQAKKRRANYEFLKAEISKRHFDGYRGLVVDFPGRKFDVIDIASFRPPMYQTIKNQDYKWCIFWDQVRLTQEIGTGAPLKEGEAPVKDHGGRTRPDGSLESIDEQTPLTETTKSDSDEPV